MSDYYQNLAERIEERFKGRVTCNVNLGELTVVVPQASLLNVCQSLRDEAEFAFEQLIDVCGVDYLDYADGQWSGKRYAVVYHLLSVSNNHRVRVRTFAENDDLPVIDSVISIWSSANWYEREAFDLYGIVFEGHPDMRRILTDYGFIGYPFRKDFPVSGHVEMRFDPEKKRVVYQPVSIEPRSMVPRVIRHDHRYLTPDAEGEGQGA